MHRDNKLDNILVKRQFNYANYKDCHEAKSYTMKYSLPIENYEFKLGDLGLAKKAKRDSQLHETFCGTPLNMAPEVLFGEL